VETPGLLKRNGKGRNKQIPLRRSRKKIQNKINSISVDYPFRQKNTKKALRMRDKRRRRTNTPTPTPHKTIQSISLRSSPVVCVSVYFFFISLSVSQLMVLFPRR
jgi:hypothetical protein